MSQDKSQSKKICNHFSLRSLNVPVYSSSCFLAENVCKKKNGDCDPLLCLAKLIDLADYLLLTLKNEK